VIVVVQASDGGILDGAFIRSICPFLGGIGPLDQFLFLRTPGMIELGEMVFNAVLVADPIEDVVESVFVAAWLVNWIPLVVSTVWMA
jgi:hypothetical protein